MVFGRIRDAAYGVADLGMTVADMANQQYQRLPTAAKRAGKVGLLGMSAFAGPGAFIPAAIGMGAKVAGNRLGSPYLGAAGNIALGYGVTQGIGGAWNMVTGGDRSTELRTNTGQSGALPPRREALPTQQQLANPQFGTATAVNSIENWGSPYNPDSYFNRANRDSNTRFLNEQEIRMRNAQDYARSAQMDMQNFAQTHAVAQQQINNYLQMRKLGMDGLIAGYQTRY